MAGQFTQNALPHRESAERGVWVSFKSIQSEKTEAEGQGAGGGEGGRKGDEFSLLQDPPKHVPGLFERAPGRNH